MGCRLDVLVHPDGPLPVGSDFWISVRATSDEPIECRSVRCAVGWRAFGREEDGSTVFEESAPGGPVGPAGALTVQFRARLPERGPVSWRGSLTAFVWRVEVSADLARARDEEVSVELEVVPRPA